MPGPNCESKITCIHCGLKKHKKKTHKYRWRVQCVTDSWEADKTYSNRHDAERLFRLHKNDADEALSKPIQRAMGELRKLGLI